MSVHGPAYPWFFIVLWLNDIRFKIPQEMFTYVCVKGIFFLAWEGINSL